MAEEAQKVTLSARPVLLFLLLLALQIFSLRFLPRRDDHRLSPTLSPDPPSQPPSPASPNCDGSWVYVYHLPPKFNADLLENCSFINPWGSICPFLSNAGMGVALTDSPSPSPLREGSSTTWYATNQFTSEIIFHNRLHRHACTTNDPSLASLFYVPFYAGLAVYRHLFSKSLLDRDILPSQLLDWLSDQPYWRRHGGLDHFFVIGRITWDFRRAYDEGWGSSFLHMPAMENTTRLIIERNPWDEREIAIPYPTSFHPRTDDDIQRWQDDVGGRRRSYLFSYAGGPRKALDLRGILLKQCEESDLCKALDCSEGKCEHPQPVLDLFLRSTFCLQPSGDSYTRRSIFDALIAGCIPVFFYNESAYWQYEWHLPSDDPTSYSVFIPNEQIMQNSTNIEKLLTDIPAGRVETMRLRVISLIPRVVYANTIDNRLIKYSDAFDLAMRGVVSRVKSARLHGQ